MGLNFVERIIVSAIVVVTVLLMALLILSLVLVRLMCVLKKLRNSRTVESAQELLSRTTGYSLDTGVVLTEAGDKTTDLNVTHSQTTGQVAILNVSVESLDDGGMYEAIHHNDGVLPAREESSGQEASRIEPERAPPESHEGSENSKKRAPPQSHEGPSALGLHSYSYSTVGEKNRLETPSDPEGLYSTISEKGAEREILQSVKQFELPPPPPPPPPPSDTNAASATVTTTAHIYSEVRKPKRKVSSSSSSSPAVAKKPQTAKSSGSQIMVPGDDTTNPSIVVHNDADRDLERSSSPPPPPPVPPRLS